MPAEQLERQRQLLRTWVAMVTLAIHNPQFGKTAASYKPLLSMLNELEPGVCTETAVVAMNTASYIVRILQDVCEDIGADLEASWRSYALMLAGTIEASDTFDG